MRVPFTKGFEDSVVSSACSIAFAYRIKRRRRV
jgi:hypothetical protein